LFTLRDAHEICLAPHLAAARRREAVRQTAEQAEGERSEGVRWSGLGAESSSRPPRTIDEVRAEAEAEQARARAFAQSPRGRFLGAVRALEQLGCAAPAEQARAAYARGFAEPDHPACPAEIGVALTALARLAQPQARAACQALAELLAASLGLAA
jgi:hypothetical protein